MREFLLAIIQSARVGLDTTALAADVIAADARFNLWFAREGKKSADDNELLDLMAAYEQSVEKCREAEAAFRADGDENRLRRSLLEVLQWLTAPRPKKP